MKNIIDNQKSIAYIYNLYKKEGKKKTCAYILSILYYFYIIFTSLINQSIIVAVTAERITESFVKFIFSFCWSFFLSLHQIWRELKIFTFRWLDCFLFCNLFIEEIFKKIDSSLKFQLQLFASHHLFMSFDVCSGWCHLVF